MSKKPILFYTIARCNWNDEQIFGVTTETPHRRLFGRWHQDDAPGAVGRYVSRYGRFETPEAAQLGIERLKEIDAIWKPQIEEARNKSLQLEQSWMNARKEVFK